MKTIQLMAVAGAMLLAGCAPLGLGRLYPVSGPIITQTPPPIYEVVLGPGLLAQVTLPNGQVYNGQRQTFKPDDPAASAMRTDWDQVYGQGFFTARILGNSGLWHYNLTDAQGKHLAVEVLVGSDAYHEGVARDEEGDVFKLTFHYQLPPLAG